MLHHKPRPFHIFVAREVFYAIYNPLKYLCWFVFRPSGLGVKIVVFHKNKLLLVRIGYGHKKWGLPGGAVDRGENAEGAAFRELLEETNLSLHTLTNIGTRFYKKKYREDTVHYFIGVSDTEDITIDDQEIVDAGWFSLDRLPKDRMPRVDEVIELYNEWKHARD